MRTMNHPTRLALAIACASFFAAGAALAQDAQTTPPPTSTTPPQATDFKQLDSNADGSISKDEAAVDAQLASDFARRDVNGDGKLSESEFASASGETTPTPPPTDDSSKQP